MVTTTAYSVGEPGQGRTEAVYTVRNPTRSRRQYTLALTVRPFQVNPPAQFLNTPGGVSPIYDLAFENGAVNVDKIASVFPRTPPQSFRAATLASDTPCEWLAAPGGPTKITDESGFASGALLYTLDLAPGESQEIILDLPQHAGEPRGEGSIGASTATARHELAVADDQARGRAAVAREAQSRRARSCRRTNQELYDTLRTALAHVLINRDGPAIQPGLAFVRAILDPRWSDDLGDAACAWGTKMSPRNSSRGTRRLSVCERQGAVLCRPSRRRSGARERQRRRVPVPDRRDLPLYRRRATAALRCGRRWSRRVEYMDKLRPLGAHARESKGRARGVLRT